MRQTQGQDHQPNAYLEELYTCSTNNALNALLKKSKEESAQLHKEGISISATEGQLVAHFVQKANCKKFVEVGTLTGYSALWILEGLSHSKNSKNIELYTIEKDPTHAAIAKRILTEAKENFFKTAKVEIIEGDAKEKLEILSSQGPFDGIFIDGNKSAYLDYLHWAEKNICHGGLILADNVFLSGAVWGQEVSHFSKKQVEVMQEFNKQLSDPKKYKTIFIPTSEGLAVAERI